MVFKVTLTAFVLAFTLYVFEEAEIVAFFLLTFTLVIVNGDALLVSFKKWIMIFLHMSSLVNYSKCFYIISNIIILKPKVC